MIFKVNNAGNLVDESGDYQIVLKFNTITMMCSTGNKDVSSRMFVVKADRVKILLDLLLDNLENIQPLDKPMRKKENIKSWAHQVAIAALQRIPKKNITLYKIPYDTVKTRNIKSIRIKQRE